MGENQQRINETLGNAWNALRHGRPYPREEEINTDVLEPVWDSCFFIQVEPEASAKKSYRYTYLGKALIDAFGEDITNQDVSAHLLDPAHSPLLHDFSEVVKTGAPVTAQSEFSNRHNMVIKYRSCMFPLGEGRVEYILGGMKWKAY